jgi:CBS domain-containing protein
MSANAYARIAERYHVNSSDDESVERFFLDVAPTLSREEREAIIAELLADESAGSATAALSEIPPEVPTFPIEDAPPIGRPISLARFVGELSFAFEKRVSERIEAAVTRALDRLHEQPPDPAAHGPGRGSDAEAPRAHRIADLIEGQTVTVVGVGATVRTAAKLMSERNIGVMAVVQEGTLAGIFSERDLMSRVVARGLDPDLTSVADVMTTDVVVVRPEDNLDSALEKMQAIGSRHLPIVHDGKLIGMISLRDLLEVADDAAPRKTTFLAELVTYAPDYNR